jgi:hypothetical protein
VTLASFVGRSAEIASLQRELDAGRNVVIIGKYGVGRTSLVREVARRLARRRFLFADFGRPPAEMCRAILEDLLEDRPRRRGTVPMGYRSALRLVAEKALGQRQQPVIVLDNVARLTPAKCDFLRRLTRSDRLRFIAIAEAFLSPADLSRLRVLLFPNALLTLDPLGTGESEEFFWSASREHGLEFAASRVRLLARVKHGYPLGMAETVARELRRRKERS